jgi:hypothetical protein
MTVLSGVEAGQRTRSFFMTMSLACAAVAFLGFAPTYFRPLASGSFKANPIIHIHALAFFGWSVFIVLQAWLVNSGNVARHRAVGLIGISLATAMTIFGFLATLNAMKHAAAIGMTEQGIAFAIVPLSGIAFFAVTFALAISAVRRPEEHKRLMLLASVSILDAAVARWFLVFLAPAGAAGPPPVGVTIPPAFVAYLLLVAAMIYDWRTRGRPHRVYVIGGTALLLVKLLNLPISMSAAWLSLAGSILALAQ